MTAPKIPPLTERLDATADADAAVARATRLLRDGQVVAIPTETVYGLAAPAMDVEAVRRVFAAKGRPADNPLIVHLAELVDVTCIADLDPLSAKLLQAFAPGPLTVVLPRRAGVPDLVTAGLDTVAVRIPATEITRRIIREVGPLAAPSANTSGRPSPTTADHVLADLNGRIAAVVDAGPCAEGLESTVIRVRDGAVTLLRPGALSAEAIEAVLGQGMRRATQADGGSPGMKHRHYAPTARIVLCSTLAEVRRAAGTASNVLVLAAEGSAPGVDHRPLTSHDLYAELRRADDLRVDKIVVLCDEAVVRQEALWNRLRKAAEAGSEEMNEGT